MLLGENDVQVSSEKSKMAFRRKQTIGANSNDCSSTEIITFHISSLVVLLLENRRIKIDNKTKHTQFREKYTREAVTMPHEVSGSKLPTLNLPDVCILSIKIVLSTPFRSL
jgi:hypothetical protein